MKRLLKAYIPTLIVYSTITLVSIVNNIFIGNFYGSIGQSAMSLVYPII